MLFRNDYIEEVGGGGGAGSREYNSAEFYRFSRSPLLPYKALPSSEQSGAEQQQQQQQQQDDASTKSDSMHEYYGFLWGHLFDHETRAELRKLSTRRIEVRIFRFSWLSVVAINSKSHSLPPHINALQGWCLVQGPHHESRHPHEGG